MRTFGLLALARHKIVETEAPCGVARFEGGKWLCQCCDDECVPESNWLEILCLSVKSYSEIFWFETFTLREFSRSWLVRKFCKLFLK